MKPILTSLILLLTAGLFPQAAATQELSKELRSQIGDFLNETARKEISVGKIHIDSVNTEGNDLILFTNINCSYIPFRTDNVSKIYQGLKALLPPELTKHKLQIRTDHHAIEELIPLALRNTKGRKIPTFSYKADIPLDYPRLSVSLYPHKRIAKPSHCSMAKSRLLLRIQIDSLGMATCTNLSDCRGPLYSELCTSISCSNARKCQVQQYFFLEKETHKLLKSLSTTIDAETDIRFIQN